MVVLMQRLFRGFTGNAESPLITVLSTLAIAALFNPLRVWIQAFIDRRFFRETYDAERVLSQFAETARDEVELDVLAEQFVHVVQETVQPEQVGLWLSDAEGRAFDSSGEAGEWEIGD